MFGETLSHYGEDSGGTPPEASGGIMRSGSSFLETVRLSETFFEQLKRHPVPVDDAAIRAINRHSMALNIYCWLAYRLHVLTGAREVSWKAFHAQFGGGVSRLDHFRTVFIENLKLALAIYPDAKVEVDGRGLRLQPSRPPVSLRVKATAISRQSPQRLTRSLLRQGRRVDQDLPIKDEQGLFLKARAGSQPA